MSTLKLIIDIDADVYTRLFDNGIPDNEIAEDDICEMVRALRHGTPLPKSHGDIVDIEHLIDMFWDGNSMEITKYDLSVIEPIIEADKESEE